MVGDNLQTDISFAKANQIDSLLVLSGCTSQEKMSNP
jgi:ribonucleotide monophosphatase NagD (HAD superfamily)